MATVKHTLYEVFLDSVRRHPAEPAIEVSGRPLSYRDLHRAAELIAETIVRSHGPVKRVGLLATRSVVAYAGYLAILRLGASVVPLNLRYPARRNHDICELGDVDVILADTMGQDWLDRERPGDGPAVLPLTDADVLAGSPDGRLSPYEADTERVAYLLFTSGSTGRPKGVPIRHRNVLPMVAHNIARYRVEPGCRMSHTFDLTFDVSVFDLFVTWGGGACLVVPEQTELLTLADYLVGRRLTHWFSVPSAVSVGAELGGLPAEPVPGLRYSMFAGEQLTYGQADTWRALAPRSVIDNLFGPTELTVLCAEYRLPVDRRHWPETSNGTVPIGDVYTHLDHLIKADTGELCVRGSQRFDGYLDPRDDSGRFLDHHEAGPLTGEHYYRTGDRVRREAGALVHLGRLDNQVKIHGYRVELGELEAVLRRHPRVSQAAVIAIEHGEETELIACYTGEPVRRGELRRSLGGWLPIHLMPHRFLHLESMPLNANGKVDRGVLRDIALHGSAASRE